MHIEIKVTRTKALDTSNVLLNSAQQNLSELDG